MGGVQVFDSVARIFCLGDTKLECNYMLNKEIAAIMVENRFYL